MKFDRQLKRFVWPFLGAAVVLFAPWFVYVLIDHEPGNVDAEMVFELSVIPVLGPAYLSAEISGDLFPEWVLDLLESSLDFPAIILWLLPVAALLWAMTILGARGRWWLTAVLAIGLAFEVISAVLLFKYG